MLTKVSDCAFGPGLLGWMSVCALAMFVTALCMKMRRCDDNRKTNMMVSSTNSTALVHHRPPAEYAARPSRDYTSLGFNWRISRNYGAL